jgi:hypothetical protein
MGLDVITKCFSKLAVNHGVWAVGWWKKVSKSKCSKKPSKLTERENFGFSLDEARWNCHFG